MGALRELLAEWEEAAGHHPELTMLVCHAAADLREALEEA